MIRPVAVRLGLLALLWAPGGGSAQSASDLAGQCVAASGDATLCARVAGAGRDLAGYVGLLIAPGAELSGQASTLGRRLGGMPRIAASLRAGGTRVVRPSLDSVGGSEESGFVTSVQATLGLGLFDGVQVLPTVGGLFSLDVIASGALLLFSESDGFGGDGASARAQALSIGARVGILRESFTLPAVTVSASRRFVGDLAFGEVGSGNAAQVLLDPGITSIRATIGKDLFAFGILAGVGWDAFSSETTARVGIGSSAFIQRTATLEESRLTYFGGVSKQIGVIAWISGEVGWTTGFDPVNVGAGASPDVGRTTFGSVALVLKL